MSSRKSRFKKGDFLYGIPSSKASEKYNLEGERVFIHSGYESADGYWILIGFHEHKIKRSSGHGNFQWGGDVRYATDEEIEEFMNKLMWQKSDITWY